jgi:uncharacterized protein (DUF1330 family)
LKGLVEAPERLVIVEFDSLEQAKKFYRFARVPGRQRSRAQGRGRHEHAGR